VGQFDGLNTAAHRRDFALERWVRRRWLFGQARGLSWNQSFP
jgi:hypothetical protein